MAQKILVSKQGVNALTSTDPNDFIVNSDYNSYFILSQGTILTQTIDTDPKTITLAHGLSYTPLVFAFANYPDGFLSLPSQGQDGEIYGRRWYLEVDGTNVYFVFYKGVGANYNVDIAYYIFNSSI